MAYKHIWELINSGALAFSEAAEDELEQEEDVKEEKENKKEDDGDIDWGNEFKDVTDITDPDGDSGQKETNEDDWFNEDINQGSEQEGDDEEEYDENDPFGFGEEPFEFDEEGGFEKEDDAELLTEDGESEVLNEEDEKPIKKIQTVDVVSKIITKYDTLMEKIDVMTWNEITNTKKKKKSDLGYWDYVEDIHKLLNKTLGKDNLIYVDTYNKLYEKLTDGNWTEGLTIYSQKNMGKPYISEGLYLLMYELTFDWATFLIKFLNDTPEINAEDFENDSFVRKFPNLTLLTYIARLVSESEEFDDFMTNKEAFNMIEDETEYNLTLKQVKQKQDMIKSAGESLTYYANIVKNDYADIIVGVLDKLGLVVYLHNNCRVSLDERFNIISELIHIIASKRPISPISNINNINGPVLENQTAPNPLSAFKAIIHLADNLILARNEARLLLDSDKSNYIMNITNE